MKSLYADTTFCVPRAFFIPKREDSISATIDLVREWISRSRAHIILLSYKANLGYEHMFMRLSEEFQMKVNAVGFRLWVNSCGTPLCEEKLDLLGILISGYLKF